MIRFGSTRDSIFRTPTWSVNPSRFTGIFPRRDYNPVRFRWRHRHIGTGVVFLEMPVQMTALRESFLTDLALVLPLPCVGNFVQSQAGVGVETLAAIAMVIALPFVTF